MPTPLEDLIAAGYQISGPGGDDGWDATGFDRQFHIPPAGAGGVLAQAKNHAKVYGKLSQAQQLFSDNYTNWASLSAAQKDAANRNAQRALANLIRHVRNDLSSEGV